MYMIEDKKGKTNHWAAAIDEEEYLALTVSLATKPTTYKLPTNGDQLEAKAVANMFRSLADEIDNGCRAYRSRRA